MILTRNIDLSGQALIELGKDKASMKQVEGNTTQFLKTLSRVEQELSRHISYLTQVSTGWLLKLSYTHIHQINKFYLTGQPHEGSSYSSHKMWKTAWHRLEHTRTRLQELENLKNRTMAVNRSAAGQSTS